MAVSNLFGYVGLGNKTGQGNFFLKTSRRRRDAVACRRDVVATSSRRRRDVVATPSQRRRDDAAPAVAPDADPAASPYVPEK